MCDSSVDHRVYRTSDWMEELALPDFSQDPNEHVSIERIGRVRVLNDRHKKSHTILRLQTATDLTRNSCRLRGSASNQVPDRFTVNTRGHTRMLLLIEIIGIDHEYLFFNTTRQVRTRN